MTIKSRRGWLFGQMREGAHFSEVVCCPQERKATHHARQALPENKYQREGWESCFCYWSKIPSPTGAGVGWWEGGWQAKVKKHMAPWSTSLPTTSSRLSQLAVTLLSFRGRKPTEPFGATACEIWFLPHSQQTMQPVYTQAFISPKGTINSCNFVQATYDKAYSFF